MSEIELANLLESIEENYTKYDIRYDIILKALLVARKLEYQCGFRFDSDEPDWPVIVILLPQGEVSWHMPPSGIVYDNSFGNSERTKQYSLFVQKQ